MSSVITIGFTGRTRACLRTEFTPPIADDERRETLIHVALLTARTFAALSPENQVTFAGTLREWIEDQFVACPTRIVPGDPLACLPRFASTFVAPAREYALASKGINNNGRGIEFFLPMALVSFLRHVAVTFPNPEELLKPALALCSAVVIQPLTMQTHFQAASASLPKVPPVVDKSVVEQPVAEEPVAQEVRREEPAYRPSPRPQPVKPSITAPARLHRGRRLSWVMTASLTALLLIVGVQYFTTYFSGRQSELPPPQPEITPPPPMVSKAPELPGSPSVPSTPPGPPPEPLPPLNGPVAPTMVPAPAVAPETPITPAPTIPPAVSTPSPETITPAPSAPRAPEAPQPPQEVITAPQPVAPPVEQPFKDTRVAPPPVMSRNVGLYQQQVHDLAEDALAQAEVMVNALEGQILTQFALSDILAYGLGAIRADLNALDRLTVPPGYEEKHRMALRTVAEIARFGRELKNLRAQPAAGELQARLTALQARLDDALRTVDSI